MCATMLLLGQVLRMPLISRHLEDHVHIFALSNVAQAHVLCALLRCADHAVDDVVLHPVQIVAHGYALRMQLLPDLRELLWHALVAIARCGLQDLQPFWKQALFGLRGQEEQLANP